MLSEAWMRLTGYNEHRSKSEVFGLAAPFSGVDAEERGEEGEGEETDPSRRVSRHGKWDGAVGIQSA